MGHRMRVAPKYGSKHRISSTLPRARAPSQNAAQGIAPSAHTETNATREATTQNQWVFQKTLLWFWEVRLANALLCSMFRATCLQGSESIFGFVMHVMLDATKDMLRITIVCLPEGSPVLERRLRR